MFIPNKALKHIIKSKVLSVQSRELKLNLTWKKCFILKYNISTLWISQESIFKHIPSLWHFCLALALFSCVLSRVSVSALLTTQLTIKKIRWTAKWTYANAATQHLHRDTAHPLTILTAACAQLWQSERLHRKLKHRGEDRLSFIRNQRLLQRHTGHQEDIWPWCTAARSPAGRSHWRVCGPLGRTEPSVVHHTHHHTLQYAIYISWVVCRSYRLLKLSLIYKY